MAQFAVTVDEFVKRAKAAPDIVVRKVATELHRDIVLGTPVDTGRARASWMIGLNRIEAPTQYTATDKSGNTTILQGMARLNSYRPGDSVWIASRLPYIERLEYGWSNQAPTGVVRIAIARWNDHLQAAIRSLPK